MTTVTADPIIKDLQKLRALAQHIEQTETVDNLLTRYEEAASPIDVDPHMVEPSTLRSMRDKKSDALANALRDATAICQMVIDHFIASRDESLTAAQDAQKQVDKAKTKSAKLLRELGFNDTEIGLGVYTGGSPPYTRDVAKRQFEFGVRHAGIVVFAQRNLDNCHHQAKIATSQIENVEQLVQRLDARLRQVLHLV